MDKLHYYGDNKKSAVPLGAQLPKDAYNLFECDLKKDYGIDGSYLPFLEWTEEGFTNLEEGKAAKESADIEKEVRRCNKLCMDYQTGDTDPRLDNNFVSIVISPYGQMKKQGLITPDQAPNCEDNLQWMNNLWMIVWEGVKAKIRAKEEYSTDFAALMVEAGFTANPPHDFDSCYAEIM